MKKIFSIIALAMLTLAIATSCSDDDVYPAKLKVYGEGIANGEVNLKAQETVQIQLSYWPEYSIKDSIEYRSTNENVATVDKNGLVRGIDTGTATILIKCTQMPKRYYFIPEHTYATATLEVHVTGSTLQLQDEEVSQSEADARQAGW